MMRSMYSGVSGLRVHQTKMDVIGNNIANVNTVGYKKGQVTFQEALSQVIKGAGAPQGGKGGTNPHQIGLGLKLGAINTVHTKGPTQRTDNPTDLMIDGDGFFIVSDDKNGENRYYTRAGNFTFDVDGNLVTPDGFKLLGKFIGDDKYAEALGIDNDKDLQGIKISKSITSPASASCKVELRGNLDKNAEDDPSTVEDESIYTTDVTVRDSLGNPYKVEISFQNNNDNSWNITDIKVTDLGLDEEVTNFTWNAPNGLKFTSDGNLDLTNSDATITIDFANAQVGGNNLSESVGFGAAEDTDNDGVIDDSKIALDFSKLTQFANESDAKAYDVEVDDQIGRASGSITGFTIDASGKVIASFSNGMKEELWQIQLAKFDNPAGLEKSGNNFFVNTPNSGEPQIGKPGNSGLGAISPGTLEMSNVDLSMEFTEMIVTQRGFQANSRIITTTDEMLQELVNMKR